MLFSRRQTEVALARIVCLMSADVSRAVVSRLNSLRRSELLGAMWEVLIIDALNRIGQVAYEPPQRGAGKVDVSFDSGQLEFHADITSVSDEGLEQQNPIDEFQRELYERIQEAGLDAPTFSFRVEGQASGRRWDDKKMKLSLPTKQEMHTVFDTQFDGFLRGIAKTDPDALDFVSDTEEAQFTVSYRKGGRRPGGNYPAYTAIYSRTKNPLYNTLKQKANQFKRADVDGCRGVIVCDGGCSLLATKMSGSHSYDARDIVQHFLKSYSSIDFVAVVNTRRNWGGFRNHESRPYLEHRVFVQPSFPEDSATELMRVMDAMMRYLPAPVYEGYQARERYSGSHYFKEQRALKGWEMKDGEIRVSSRALLNLMAGSLSIEDFSRTYSVSQGAENLFARELIKGNMIAEMRVERDASTDDDWVVLRFEADVAIGLFRTKQVDK